MPGPREKRRTCIGASAAFAAMLSLTFGCASVAQRSREEVSVAPFDQQQTQASYARLEDRVMRYANRFGTRVALAANQIIESTEDPSERLDILRWRNVSNLTMLNMAVGPNAVSNLLDMTVVTTLSRMTLQDYWIPQVLGEARGGPLLEAYRVLEDDVWGVAGQVLTQEQQTSLRTLIEDWHRDNPDQVYPWYVRFDEFSGQRAAELRRVEQSNGLLGIRGATQSVDEVRALAERIMFYLENAPNLMTHSLEESTLQLIQAPEVHSAAEDLDRFIDTSQELVAVVSQLPNEQFEAIRQFMQELDEQRTKFFEAFEGSGPQAEAALSELHASLDSFERILILTGYGTDRPPNGKRFDIKEYKDFAAGAAETARELHSAIDGLEALLSSPSWTEHEPRSLLLLLDRFQTTESALIDRLALMAILVITFFFVALLGYRLTVAHILGKRTSRPS